MVEISAQTDRRPRIWVRWKGRVLDLDVVDNNRRRFRLRGKLRGQRGRRTRWNRRGREETAGVERRTASTRPVGDVREIAYCGPGFRGYSL
jgi:hypothetical protein